jgi:hypothetical protein
MLDDLEVRTYGPLVKDPDLSVLVDSLLQRGASVAEWTDEEAERCRLAAFFPETGMWFEDFTAPSHWHAGPCREWTRAGWVVAIERPFSAYDPSPDCSLRQPIEEWPNTGVPLPEWCLRTDGEPLPWSMLVFTAKWRLEAQRAERSKRKARKAARAEARP